MPPSLLILISADPSISGRPAEAVRLAAGLAASQQIEVQVYLHGPAVKTLAPEHYEAIDADVISQNWPLAASPKTPVWAQTGTLQKYRIIDPPVPCLETDMEILQRRLHDRNFVIHFDPVPNGPIFYDQDRLPPTAKAVQLPLILSGKEPEIGPTIVFDLTQPTLDYRQLLLAIFQTDRSATL
jgi:hypothetical protein